MFKKIFILVLLLCLSQSAMASVIINEIAWQGYGDDANNEWIEIYNQGSSLVSFDGWLLEAVDGTPSINLSGLTIDSGSFLLLERTDDGSVPEVLGDTFYTGALSNTGEHLVLKNAESATVDEANFSSGWEYPQDMLHTLSRFGSSWGEGLPTPKAENEQVSASDTNSQDDDSQEDQESATSASASTSQSDSAAKLPTYKTRKLSLFADKHGFVQVPLEFSSHVRDYDGSEIRRGVFVWNMGDGTLFVQSKSEPVTHVYQYPGEYVVSLAFNKNHFGQEIEELEPDLLEEHIVSVVDKPVMIENFTSQYLILKNVSKQQVDVGGWHLRNESGSFKIPLRTFIRPGKTLTLPSSRTGLVSNPISLATPTGVVSGVWDESAVFVASSSSQASYESSLSTSVPGAVLSEETLSTATQTTEEGSFVVPRELAASPLRQASSSLYIALFLFVVIAGSFAVWFVVRKDEQQNQIDGYTIVEEE